RTGLEPRRRCLLKLRGRAQGHEEQRPELLQDRLPVDTPVVGRQHRQERSQQAEAQTEVLLLHERYGDHQNDSPPCATTRGRTVPTTRRGALLDALEKSA